MTELLENAIAEASKLNPTEQDVLAQLLLDEMESERRWDEAFANSQDALAKLAATALAEHARGETKPLHTDDQ
jgi:hypothetical protein